MSIRPLETPPDVPSGFPVGFPEHGGRDDAALALQPRLLVGRFGFQLLGAGIVGGVGERKSLGEPGNQAPLALNQLTRVGGMAGGAANEIAWRAREYIDLPIVHWSGEMEILEQALGRGELVLIAHRGSMDQQTVNVVGRLCRLCKGGCDSFGRAGSGRETALREAKTPRQNLWITAAYCQAPS